MTRGQVIAFGAGILTLAGASSPAVASAASVNVQTQTIIPHTGTSCAPLSVQNVVPYIYNNNLDSFDVTIADPTYVSVLGSAGDTGIPLAYMSRYTNPDGTIRIHIDLDGTPIPGVLPVSLTLLSAPSSGQLCISVISFSVLGTYLAHTAGTATPSSSTSTNKSPGMTQASSSTAATTSVTGSTSTNTTIAGSVVSSGLQGAVIRTCEAAGPYQLWFVLLALFMVIVGLIAFAEPPLADKNPNVPLAGILIPLVLLLLFWYFAPSCRVAGWIPFVLIVAAAIGLVTAFRDKEMPIGNVIQLPQAKPSVKQIVTVTEKTTVLAKTVSTIPQVKTK
jgi:hypothetical protein